jgi:hypothetical protein
LFLALTSEFNYSGFLLAGSLIKLITVWISDRVVKCCTILGAAGATDALRLLDLVDRTGILFLAETLTGVTSRDFVDFSKDRWSNGFIIFSLLKDVTDFIISGLDKSENKSFF